ncbi:hypothetical protein GCM10023221_07560 [Luteimicrobium xylanilyticum]
MWPGTNSVNEFATATIGLPMSLEATPDARISARAPAMLRPWVTVRERSEGMVTFPHSHPRNRKTALVLVVGVLVPD